MTAVSEQTELDFAALVRQHQANVWRYVRFLGASTADADDLTQETFLALNRAQFKQRSEHETAAYLRTIARNQLLMARRRQGREVNTVELEAAEQVWVTTGNKNVYLDSLSVCLDKLDGHARIAIHQFYHEQRSRIEIANQFNMTPEGIKTLLRRTREILRHCIEQQTRAQNEPQN